MIQQLIRYDSTQDTAAHLGLVKTQQLILDYLWQRPAHHYLGHSCSFYRYYLAGWVGQWYLAVAWNSRAKGPKLWMLKDNLDSHGANEKRDFSVSLQTPGTIAHNRLLLWWHWTWGEWAPSDFYAWWYWLKQLMSLVNPGQFRVQSPVYCVYMEKTWSGMDNLLLPEVQNLHLKKCSSFALSERNEWFFSWVIRQLVKYLVLFLTILVCLTVE